MIPNHSQPTKYILEIYFDEMGQHPWTVFESEDPFGAISKGDLLNPGSWDAKVKPSARLRVVNVEHLIWKGENGLKHQTLVYTTFLEVNSQAALYSDLP